jgi:hypothetical protein
MIIINITALAIGHVRTSLCFNPLNAELNPICHLLALLGAHHILHVIRIRVKISHSSFVADVSSCCRFMLLHFERSSENVVQSVASIYT